MEESFFCGIGRRDTGGSRLVDGILTVKRERYEATEMMKWDVNVTQTTACGDHPSSVDPFKHKETKITMYTVRKPALLQISQCPHFPCLSWAVTSSLHLSLSWTHTHTHALMGQTESCVPQSLGERERTVSCLRCRFIIRHQLSSLEAQCYWTALDICREDYRLKTQIWSFWSYPILCQIWYRWSATRLNASAI